MYGYRQEHHAEVSGMGKTARPQSRQESNYPQGYVGTLYDGQSRTKLAERERRPKSGITIVSFSAGNPKPSAFESEIHPSHKPTVCTLGISPLQGAVYHSFGQCAAAMIHEKTARCFLRCPSAYAAETAATDLSVAKRVCPSREEGVYGKTLIYTDVEAAKCQGKNILYHKPRKTGKSLCHLPHRRQ